jgi:hypothetical protein
MVFYHLSCIGHRLWRFMGSFRPKTLASGWLFVEFLLLFFTLQRRATGFAHDARHRTFRTRSRESSFRWTLGLVSNRRPTFGFYLGRPMFFSFLCEPARRPGHIDGNGRLPPRLSSLAECTQRLSCSHLMMMTWLRSMSTLANDHAKPGIDGWSAQHCTLI